MSVTILIGSGLARTKEEITMMKIFAVCLFAMFACAGAARAGGGAEPMPGTNYTDLPPYHPYYADAPIISPLPYPAGPDGRARIGGPIRRSTSLTTSRRAAMARPSVPFQKL